MSKRTRKRVLKFPNIDPSAALAAYKLAKPSFEKLVANGVSPDTLNKFMLHIWFAALHPKRSDWDKPLSMEWHTLKRFPARLKTLAETIEQLNADPFLEPRTHLLTAEERERLQSKNALEQLRMPKDMRDRERLASDFHDLPKILMQYGKYIPWLTAQTGRLRRHPYRPLTHYLVALLGLIHRITGRFFYEDVAELATHVVAAARQNQVFSAGQLRSLYKSNPDLRIRVRL